jgi:heme exporter protein C
VNVPIIYFSVQWWNTLHQGASVSFTQSPRMASVMLTGMLLMSLAMWLYAAAIALWRVRSLILLRESHASWVQQLPEVQTYRLTRGAA